MQKMKVFAKALSIGLAVCMLSQDVVYAAPEDTYDVSTTAETDSDFYYYGYDNYSEYLSKIEAQNDSEKTLTFSAASYEAAESEGVTSSIHDDIEAMNINEYGTLTLPIEVKESGFYNVVLDYYPVQNGTSAIKFEMLIDGELPFQEAGSFSLKRVWKDSTEKEYDSQGNQIRLPSEETPMWMQETLRDASGFTREPFRFYFTEGKHTLTFSVYQNVLTLNKVMLTAPQHLPTYQEIYSFYKNNKLEEATSVKRVEAEAAVAKSDRSIVTVNDKTSPVTVPYSGAEIVYNTIGAGSWKTVGEWVEWQFEVPKDGLYTLVLRYKQDIKAGDVSFRTLYIDGQVPFQEARSLVFPYDGNWQTKTIGDGDKPYEFYLTKGVHTIRMEATLGEYSSVIAKVSSTLTELNGIYTDIVMVTGPEPDVDRDYQFEKMIPDVLKDIERLSKNLRKIESELESLTGEDGGENTAVIRRLYLQMEEMVEEPDTISKRLKNYMSDLSSLGTWINTSREQPLQLDYLMLSNKDEGTPKDKSNLFSVLKYHVSQFLYSFKMDYANVGNQEAEVDTEITVWISAGRDQADIIRQLVNESFTPEHGIGVNVQLVDAGSLMPATLADVGPDVYIGMAQNQPVEYALRNAVVNLSQFEDVDEVTKRFYSDSLTSFYLDEELYALPDTMSYPMLFYRKDILTELGIKEEDLATWDGLLQKVLPELDMNNFDFGLITNINTFGNFLYQNGGSFYNDTNTASAFDTSEAIKSFETMTSMYTDYGLPLSFDFANRFRSGQMPLAVAEFTSYNQLSIFAPEIEGLWGMLPIPGIENEKGIIDNTALCTVTGSVILSNSEYVDESWEFLKWWTEETTQSRYANELEAVMGTGARYATANMEAMQTVEWSRDIKEALTKQQGNLVGMPNIAGGYYTSRNYDFAFRDVVYNGKNLRETLADATTSITKEIEDKRAEFYGE